MTELLVKNDEPIVVKTKLSKKEKTQKLLDELAELKDSVAESLPDDFVIEKVKKPRSEKQKATLDKANESRRLKTLERKAKKEKEDAKQKKVTDRKIIDKAIKIKKKQIRNHKILDSESESEEEEQEEEQVEVFEKIKPIKSIKPIILKPPQPIKIPERTIRFV